MFKNKLGFTLIELLVVVALIGVSVSIAIPSWNMVDQKRRLTNVTEQVSAFMVVAQSEAQKRNQPVSLSFNRSGPQNWCLGTVTGTSGCDCTETNPEATQHCAIDGNKSTFQSTDFHVTNLTEASDRLPSGGDSFITFDPIRGIVQPFGDNLKMTFESNGGHFQLQLLINPTGLLFICSPEDSTKVSGYDRCRT